VSPPVISLDEIRAAATPSLIMAAEAAGRLCDELHQAGIDARPAILSETAGAGCVTDDHQQCLDHGDFGNAEAAAVWGNVE
jgi:hypothetical protein